jgi:hypothetical protein
VSGQGSRSYNAVVRLDRLVPFRPPAPDDAGPNPLVERVVQRPLNRVLAFTGRTIDDVVNDPVAKNEVYGYYKLYRQIERAGEVRDLERQWNPNA